MSRIAFVFACTLLAVGCTASWSQNLSNDEGDAERGAFIGGRGLVSSEGPAGTFINPTSGTMPKGTITAETCVATFDNGSGGTFVGNKILVSYAVTDWFELGATSLDIQNDNDSLSAGPHFRARLLKDEGKAKPEVAVGYYSNEANIVGAIPQYKRVGFLAASKGFLEKDEGVFRGARVHAGVRHAWRGGGTGSDTVGYFAGEVALPFYTYFIGEVSTDELTPATHPRTPFAFGFQVRHPKGVGFSIAGMQPGFSADIGLYVGIGIGFDF